MSIAVGDNCCRSSRGGRIEGSGGLTYGNEMPPDLLIGGGNLEERREDCSESSSIGKNSDMSGGLSSECEDSGGRTADEEVQSSYKGGGGGALDAMDALEEVLPFRRGMSRFYKGKSKSFASLAYASSSSSIQDIAKPENAYTRRRRNLLASSLGWDRNHRSSPLSRSNGAAAAVVAAGGISKRFTTNLSRTKLALAVAMSNTPETDDNLNLISRSSSTAIRLPFPDDQKSSSLSPHLRGDFSAWRSLSLADLHSAAASVANTPPHASSGSSSSSDENHSPY